MARKALALVHKGSKQQAEASIPHYIRERPISEEWLFQGKAVCELAAETRLQHGDADQTGRAPHASGAGNDDSRNLRQVPGFRRAQRKFRKFLHQPLRLQWLTCTPARIPEEHYRDKGALSLDRAGPWHLI